LEQLTLNLNPSLHYKLNQQALMHGKNLNQYVVEILAAYIEESQQAEPV
jgi:predicted HicB family RNase H-like nuclease